MIDHQIDVIRPLNSIPISYPDGNVLLTDEDGKPIPYIIEPIIDVGNLYGQRVSISFFGKNFSELSTIEKSRYYGYNNEGHYFKHNNKLLWMNKDYVYSILFQAKIDADIKFKTTKTFYRVVYDSNVASWEPYIDVILKEGLGTFYINAKVTTLKKIGADVIIFNATATKQSQLRPTLSRSAMIASSTPDTKSVSSTFFSKTMNDWYKLDPGVSNFELETFTVPMIKHYRLVIENEKSVSAMVYYTFTVPENIIIPKSKLFLYDENIKYDLSINDYYKGDMATISLFQINYIKGDFVVSVTSDNKTSTTIHKIYMTVSVDDSYIGNVVEMNYRIGTNEIKSSKLSKLVDGKMVAVDDTVKIENEDGNLVFNLPLNESSVTYSLRLENSY